MQLETALSTLGIPYRKDVPYSKLGYWRIGGNLAFLCEPSSVLVLQSLIRMGAPVYVLGNGSNMLMADEGLSGVSVMLRGGLGSLDILEKEDVIRCGAGLKNVVLLNRMNRFSLGGLGALAGVPGTIGGAIRMNAGTALGEIGERVVKVEWLDQHGRIHMSTQEELAFSYRRAKGLPWEAIVTRVWLRVQREGFGEEKERVSAHIERRKRTQPLHLPSCGSVFKNPAGDYAGRLIESCGLKGHSVGGAQFSPKHANFIVNNGDASAMDVYRLIRLARDRVCDAHGIVLEPEVRPMGDWPAGFWPLGTERKKETQ
jgi:UDP-N-acetylmuramate dehydrogenase